MEEGFGGGVCGAEGFQLFQVGDFEFNGIAPGSTAVPADEEGCAGSEGAFGFGDFRVNGGGRGDLQVAGVCLCRRPMRVVDFASDEDAGGGEVAGGAVAEFKGDACPRMCGAECHFCCLAGGEVGHCIAEGLCEALHHAAVDVALREGGHVFCHDYVVVTGAADVIICNALFDGLAEPVEIGVEFCHVVFEQGLLHGDEGIFAFDDVACVAQGVVGVVDMQFERVEVVDFKISFCLCHSGNC